MPSKGLEPSQAVPCFLRLEKPRFCPRLVDFELVPCRPRTLGIWLYRRSTKTVLPFKTCLLPSSLCLLSPGYWRTNEGSRCVFSTLSDQGTQRALRHLIRRWLAAFQAFARPFIHSRSQVHSFRRHGGTPALPLRGNVVILVSILPSRFIHVDIEDTHLFKSMNSTETTPCRLYRCSWAHRPFTQLTSMWCDKSQRAAGRRGSISRRKPVRGSSTILPSLC